MNRLQNKWELSRRDFIKISGIISGGLIVGCSSKAVESISMDSEGSSDLGLWVRIGNDGSAHILVPSSEMGQGSHTSLAMIVAEELDLDWERVTVTTGSNNSAYESNMIIGQLTGGSQSIVKWWEPLKEISSNIRLLLLQTAAKKWNVPLESLTTENSIVSDRKTGKSISYGELVPLTKGMDLPSDAVPKDPKKYRLVGKSVPRKKNKDIVAGTAEYGIDVVLPDMLIGGILHPDKFGGKAVSFNREAVMKISGVKDAAIISSGLAVVGENYYAVKKGLEASEVSFEGGLTLNDTDIETGLTSALDEESRAEFPDAADTIDVEYTVPYLAHAAMEPMNCTAYVRQDSCDIWVPTQAQTMAADAAADMAGLDKDNVTVHTTLLGGGFGRRAEADFVKEAVEMSKTFGKPVKLIWSREQDIKNDVFRPAAKIRFQAAFNDNKEITGLAAQEATPSILKRFMPDFVIGMFGDATSKEGIDNTPYSFPDFDYDLIEYDPGIPVGFWRSVGHSFNAFFMESFIDEMSEKFGEDPLEYRLSLLKEKPRHRKVLETLRNLSNWQNQKNYGIALHESFGSIVGAVVVLSNVDEAVRIDKVYAVADIGKYVNKSNVIDQISGGFIFGLTAAVSGQINFEEGRIRQSNFHDYTMMTLKNSPEFHIEVIESTDAPGGAGEPGTPPAAPALANAIARFTGKRIRKLPLKNEISFV